MSIKSFSSYFAVIAGNLTKCEKERKKANEAFRQGNYTAKIYIPRCKPNGMFSKVQCGGIAVECWCTTEEGEEIKGTRRNGGTDCSQGNLEDEFQ